MTSAQPQQIVSPDIIKLDIKSPNDAVISIPAVNQAKPKPIIGIQLDTIAINPEGLKRCFIRKVLTILVLQLLVITIAIILTFTLKTGTREHMQKHQYELWIAFGISISIPILAAWFRDCFQESSSKLYTPITLHLHFFIYDGYGNCCDKQHNSSIRRRFYIVCSLLHCLLCLEGLEYQH